GTASFSISVFNLMNAILGSGILGLAYAMAQLGIVLFFVCSILVAFLALYAIHLLLILCEQTGVKAYEKLGFEAFGLPGRITAAVCILMQNIGAMCSYLFIVKYELPNVLMTFMGMANDDGSWYLNGDYLVVIVTVAIILPLATFKNIGFLGYTSGFSISCMFFFTGVVIAKKFVIPCPLFDSPSFDHNNMSVTAENNSHLQLEVNQFTTAENKCVAKLFALTDRWAYSIPTMTFSFVCHTAVLPIYAEIERPTPARMQKVANTSIGLCFVLYSLASLFGYLTFYNWMEAEMLLMYSYVNASDVMTLIVRLTVLLAVVLTVPLTHFPARKALTFLIFPDRDFSWKIHLGIMTFLLSLINVLVIFVPSIREVFGIIGATASTMLVFILPCVFFLKIDPRPMKSAKKISAAVMMCVGLCLMLESLTVIVVGY
uniref:Amino acid transporter transmembrane domain-containing protein n=1 Tax=Ciona savignyi TaxID=51511 RepID=H2YM25_CIOSA